MGKYVVGFDAETWSIDKVGGKAQGLFRSAEAGLDIPTGFVIVTDAFDTVIERVITRVSTVEELQAALMEVEFPDGFVDEIRHQLEVIGASSWAVRSSAVAEDGERSFAGQQHTVLKARGLQAVLTAIREVWASLYDKAGLVYRTRLAVDDVPTGMAVVVQEMLAPETAGVMFTRNPITKNAREAVISASPGLGVDVVEGAACDTFFVERPSGYLTHREIIDTPTLNERQLTELAQVCDQVERIFDGAPMDIEWAFARSNRPDEGLKFYILQARPITHFDLHEEASTVWTNTNVGEALPGVATPLTWSILKGFSRDGFTAAFASMGLDVPKDAELVGSFYGRVYLNLSEFVSIASAIPVLSPQRLFSVAGGGGVELLEDSVPKQSSARFIARLPTTIPKVLASQASMPFLAPFWESYFETRCEEFFARDLYRLNHRALRDELDTLNTLFDRTGLVMLTVSSNFLMSYVVAGEFLRMFGSADAVRNEQKLYGALEVASAEPGRALLEMGRIARRSRRLRRIISELPAAKVFDELNKNAHYSDVEHLLDELRSFRKRFGHRAPREAELSTPRWREDVSFVFEVIRGFIDTRHLPSPKEVQREHRRALKEIDAIIHEGFAPGVAELFKLVLTFARGNARRRESLRARVVDSLDMYRHFFLECGRRMVQNGDLLVADDVFFLHIDEIRTWLSDVNAGRPFRLRVIVRKALYDVFSDLPEPPHTFLLRGSEIIPEDEALDRLNPDDPKPHSDQLQGLPASPGRVTGRAKVIRDPHSGDTVNPGEILVVPYADVGWTPLFVAASAVVMSLGGPLSHASIVAREFQIPAVVNAKHAMDRIKTGDLITVDGDRGVVFVRKDSED